MPEAGGPTMKILFYSGSDSFLIKKSMGSDGYEIISAFVRSSKIS